MSRVVNVCFHGIGVPRRALEPGEAPYWVGQPTFLSALDFIALRPDGVALSFDDGNESDVTVALPALLERGLKASFFIVANRIDTPGSLDGDSIRCLADSGMTVGLHGMTHRSWRHLDDAGLAAELDDARELICQQSRRRVDWAACPLGQYDRRVLRALRARHFTKVFTSDRATARAGAWLQPRHSIVGTQDVASIQATVIRSGSGPLSVATAVRRAVKAVR